MNSHIDHFERRLSPKNEELFKCFKCKKEFFEEQTISHAEECYGCRECGAPKKFTDKKAHYRGCKSMTEDRQKIDFTKPLRTSGGWEVEIYNAERRHGAVRLSDGWRLVKWGIHGQPECQTYGFDLVQEKDKQVVYANIYKSNAGTLCMGPLYDNGKMALEYESGNRVGCIRIELEEGRFDE